jgi:endonuclease YncB( thermonuclease family)
VQFGPRASRKAASRRFAWWAWAALLVAPILGIGAAWVWNVAESALSLGLVKSVSGDHATEEYDVSFSECSGPIRYNCVVDGDTFWLRGTKIRIADINTPEVSNPKCSREAMLGAQATRRLVELLNAGGFSLRKVNREEDRYGRKLRTVTRGGISIGETLVNEGLAEPWTRRRGSSC